MGKSVTVTIKGISPLLMHKYPLVAPEVADDKVPPKEQAERRAYRIPGDTELYVPGVAIQRCIVSAAVYSKGKGRASLQKQTAACVLVTPEYAGLGTTKFEVDSRPVVIPSTKGRVVRHRPRINDWSTAFTLEYDERLLTEKQLREIVDNAGSRCGLLDFRPEKKGPFGRFMVTEWKNN